MRGGVTNSILLWTSPSRAAPPHGNPDIVAWWDHIEGKIRAFTADLMATQDKLHKEIYEIKTWHGKEDATKKYSVGSVKRKSHHNVAKGGSKAATSWAAGNFGGRKRRRRT